LHNFEIHLRRDKHGQVVVAMNIDKPGRHGQSVPVDFNTAAAGYCPDVCDPVVVDSDVGDERRVTVPVEQAAWRITTS
jgi:hypothetical protein